MTVLVTSANGKSGRHLIPELVRRGHRVRALDVSPAAASLRALGAEEVVVGSMEEPSVLARAVDGVTAVVHIGPPLHPSETAMGHAVIAAAEAAGVERFLLYSVTHPQLDALMNHRAKLLVEDRLLTARLTPTIVRPMHYMQNLPPAAIRDAGMLMLPYSVQQGLSFVDMADVAEVAARIIGEDGHAWATYDLVGTDYLSGEQIAALIARITGVEVRAEAISVDAFLDSYLPPEARSVYTVDAFHRLFGHYDRHGIAGNPNVLGWLLGRQPTTFEQYVRRELEAA
jgi:uncharacterized protein YbjT (DUF2867 family)